MNLPTARQGNTLDAREINHALRHTRFRGVVRHFAEVPSTNDLALVAAAEGVPSGVWVADAQSAGRGRGGHHWHSAPGDGLYLSVLWTPRLPASNLQLSLLAGLSAWQAIREVTGLTVDIRWPNDLVTRTSPELPHEPARKLGGILAETAVHLAEPGAPASLRYAVIGIGLNVAHRAFPPELAPLATSLFLEGWQVPDRQPLLVALLAHLDSQMEALETQALEATLPGHASPAAAPAGDAVLLRFAEVSTWVRGKRVHVPEDGGYTGTTAGLDPSGFLLVAGDDGRSHTVRTGGVRAL